MSNLQPLTVRMEKDLYEEIRKIAYLRNEHIAQLVREGLEHIVEKHKRILTSKDTAV